MKAYYLSIRDNDDEGGEIVFANTAQEARKQVYGTDLQFESWIDVQAHRYKNWDGKENLPLIELRKEQWREGWWFHEGGAPDPDEDTDEAFYDWYKKNFEVPNVR